MSLLEDELPLGPAIKDPSVEPNTSETEGFLFVGVTGASVPLFESSLELSEPEAVTEPDPVLVPESPPAEESLEPLEGLEEPLPVEPELLLPVPVADPFVSPPLPSLLSVSGFCGG